MPRQSNENAIDLEAALAGILYAVQEAKRLGDLESARLMESYKKEKSLSKFAAPSFTISELEVELRFAVVGHKEAKAKKSETPRLKIDMTAASLKDIDPSQLQIMRLKIGTTTSRTSEQTTEE